MLGAIERDPMLLAARFQFQRGIHGNAVQPAANARPANRTRFLHQHQKRGLESILGIGFIAENAATRLPHGASMAMEEQLERSRVPR